MQGSNVGKDKKTENDDKETEEIRSTAVVKYSVPKVENFVELQCNTNLNLPPTNWLSDSADSYGLQRVSHGPKGFSSFRMAQIFPEVVVNVDVIADAENIKKLLKCPYNKEVISMIVHRVENTLLIDNFDIYEKIIRARSQNKDFKWLEEFIIKHLGAKACQDVRNIYVKHRTREALKEKNLLSKFRYHSLVPKQNELIHDNNVNQAHSSRSVEYPILPNPSPDTETPDSETFNQEYNRNVVWTFENIQMLLGTDMPIFGRGTYPCISLRLRDVNKPINILTGIDYWLDNLMSNVPEVFMCYHDNGIVQKYELIKTQDIPRLKNSRFSPLVIKEVAQNILSFLKTNATKAGHTYWLFKAKDEDIIKLYDLTCLVPEDEKLQNPFTIPVAMLLYRVARSFMKSNEKKPSGTVKKLLTNCLKLLEEQKYPEIVTSSHFMLSEIYIPVDTNPENPVFEEKGCDDDLVYETDDEVLTSDGEPESAINYLDLEAKMTSTFVNKTATPITGTAEERCLQAIHHISKGLNCLKFFTEETKNVLREEQVPMAKPNEPIPMGYSKLTDTKKGKKGRKNKDKKKKTEKSLSDSTEVVDEENALLIKCSQEAQKLPTWKERPAKQDGISWKDHLKILLYEKALLVYATLAEYYYVTNSYGNSLRCIGILARSSVIMNKLGTPNQLRENCLLGRAGDCFFMIANNWHNLNTYRSQLKSHSKEDNQMLRQLESDERLYGIEIEQHNIKCVFVYDIISIMQMLLQAKDCYEAARMVSETDSIIQRLGCCLNDVAKYYLNCSKTLENQDMWEVASKAESHLEYALELFEKIKDKNNIALVYANMGNMHRVLWYASAPPKRTELTQKEKSCFNKAVTYYKKALNTLGCRDSNHDIWNNVNWELSTTLYNMACIMEQHPPKNMSREDAEREVLEALQKALYYCDYSEDDLKFPLYQYRAATIYYKMASIHHKHALSVMEDASTKKMVVSLSRINYEKAGKLFLLARDPINYFTALMQRLAVTESLAESAVDPNIKLKHLRDAVEILVEAQYMIDILIKENNEDECIHHAVENDENFLYSTVFSLLQLVKRRLQHILKNLLKLCTKNPPNKGCPKLSEIYRECYRITFILKEDMTQEELLLNLNDVLIKIKHMVEKK